MGSLVMTLPTMVRKIKYRIMKQNTKGVGWSKNRTDGEKSLRRKSYRSGKKTEIKRKGLSNYNAPIKKISTKYGERERERKFRPISANTHGFWNYESSWGTDIMINNEKADFVCIRDTHNVKYSGVNVGNYKIFLAKDEDGESGRKGIGGVSITVRNNLLGTITNEKTI